MDDDDSALLGGNNVGTTSDDPEILTILVRNETKFCSKNRAAEKSIRILTRVSKRVAYA